jgi:hypothetical protein
MKAARIQLASARWPVTKGFVIHREIQTRDRGKSFSAELTYQFSISGNEFKKTISLGKHSTESGAQQELNAVPNIIEVRYHSEHPEENTTALVKVGLIEIALLVLYGIFATFFLYLFLVQMFSFLF